MAVPQSFIQALRTNVSHIFAIGDIVGQPMLANKAVLEVHVAGHQSQKRPVSLNGVRPRNVQNWNPHRFGFFAIGSVAKSLNQRIPRPAPLPTNCEQLLRHQVGEFAISGGTRYTADGHVFFCAHAA